MNCETSLQWFQCPVGCICCEVVYQNCNVRLYYSTNNGLSENITQNVHPFAKESLFDMLKFCNLSLEIFMVLWSYKTQCTRGYQNMLVACGWTPARDPLPSGPWDQYIIAYIKWWKCQCYRTYDGKVENKSEPANVDGIDNMTCIQCIVDWKNVIFIYIYIYIYKY